MKNIKNKAFSNCFQQKVLSWHFLWLYWKSLGKAILKYKEGYCGKWHLNYQNVKVILVFSYVFSLYLLYHLPKSRWGKFPDGWGTLAPFLFQLHIRVRRVNYLTSGWFWSQYHIPLGLRGLSHTWKALGRSSETFSITREKDSCHGKLSTVFRVKSRLPNPTGCFSFSDSSLLYPFFITH